MKRRSFLQSIGALGLAPMMPIPSLTAAPAAATVITKDTYMWAETIVRAHNKCNLGMLQRLLQLDSATASAIKSELLKNGVISAQANAYGMHTAIRPLYEGAFVRPTSEIEKLKNAAKSISTDSENNTSDFKELDAESESLSEEENIPLEEEDNADTLALDETEGEQNDDERIIG